MIIEDTNCNLDNAALDWQTRAQLRRAALKAAKMLEENRDLYEQERAQTLAVFEQMRRAGQQTATT
jgi:hypothetical protein